jgi:hypothetical protein
MESICSRTHRVRAEAGDHGYCWHSVAVRVRNRAADQTVRRGGRQLAVAEEVGDCARRRWEWGGRPVPTGRARTESIFAGLVVQGFSSRYAGADGRRSVAFGSSARDAQRGRSGVSDCIVDVVVVDEAPIIRLGMMAALRNAFLPSKYASYLAEGQGSVRVSRSRCPCSGSCAVMPSRSTRTNRRGHTWKRQAAYI